MWVWLAFLTIAICLIFVISFYIWLYILAEKQESDFKKKEEAYDHITEMFRSITDSPTETSQAAEISALNEYVEADKRRRVDILSDLLLEGMMNGDASDERSYKALYRVLKEINPQQYYSEMLRNGSSYEKAYACKMLGAFYEKDEIPEIRKCLYSKNTTISYNAAMALSILGDEESVEQFILSCGEDFDYSHRIIIELFYVFSGDVKSLALNCYEKGTDYVKSSVMKAVAKYRLNDLENIFLQASKHKDPDLRVAAIKALGELGKPEYEQTLITAVNDSVWYVSSAAVKSLVRYNTPNSRQALLSAVKNSNWWVRNSAAHTIVEMENGLELAEIVLSGYDRFAADAVKYALYKKRTD